MLRGPLNALFLLCVGVLALGACGKSKPVGLTDDAAAGTGGAGDGAVPDSGAPDRGHADADADGAVTATATLVKAITLPGIPVATTYNAGTKKAYFACRSAGDAGAGTTIAVVDDATNTVVAKIDVAGAVTGLTANATTKTVYAAEADQVDVIDGTTDTVTATVKTPDGSTILGVAAAHLDDKTNLVYVVGRKDPIYALYVIDAATNVMTSFRNINMIPAGSPCIAVDEARQLVFVMGADSNGSALMVSFNGMLGMPSSGSPQKVADSESMVSPTASGVVALGNGQAAALFVGPNLIKRLTLPDVKLPAGFTPTGIAAAAGPGGLNVLIVGFGANGGSEIQVLDAASGVLSPLALSIDGDAPAGTVAAGVMTAGPLTGGTELYVDESDKGTPPAGLPETLKIDLHAASR
jgi:hypothetical protein